MLSLPPEHRQSWSTRLQRVAGLFACLWCLGCATTNSTPVARRAFHPRESRATTQARELTIRAAQKYAAGETRAAWQLVRQARQIDPKYTGGLTLEVELTRDLGLEEEHTLALLAWMAAEPQNADVYHAAGLALMRKGYVPSGLRALEWAVALAPRDSGYALDLAAEYVALDNSRVAENVFEVALQSQPQDPVLLAALAQMSAASVRTESDESALELLAESGKIPEQVPDSELGRVSVDALPNLFTLISATESSDAPPQPPDANSADSETEAPVIFARKPVPTSAPISIVPPAPLPLPSTPTGPVIRPGVSRKAGPAVGELLLMPGERLKFASETSPRESEPLSVPVAEEPAPPPEEEITGPDLLLDEMQR